MSDFYRTHGALSEPGQFREKLAMVPLDLLTMCAFIQGIVIHADWAAAYGVKDTALSRETLPVPQRLARCSTRRNGPAYHRRGGRLAPAATMH